MGLSITGILHNLSAFLLSHALSYGKPHDPGLFVPSTVSFLLYPVRFLCDRTQIIQTLRHRILCSYVSHHVL
jgi:hypothetical protein